jgi:hypothetical protein
MNMTAVFQRDERAWSSVPTVIMVVFCMALAAQISWYLMQPEPQARMQELPAPPALNMLRLAGLDDPVTLSGMLSLWLQAFDNQPGISIPFNRLDYDRVIQWLERTMQLDPRTHYPLLAASRLYAHVPDAGKKRKMLAFVHAQFLQDPARRWQWLAHCIYVAKYQLQDLELALQFAEALRLNTSAPEVPYWARHMEVYLLEDMGDIEAAKVLIGGLLDSGAIADPREIRFLEDRLQSLVAESGATPGSNR